MQHSHLHSFFFLLKNFGELFGDASDAESLFSCSATLSIIFLYLFWSATFEFEVVSDTALEHHVRVLQVLCTSSHLRELLLQIFRHVQTSFHFQTTLDFHIIDTFCSLLQFVSSSCFEIRFFASTSSFSSSSSLLKPSTPTLFYSTPPLSFPFLPNHFSTSHILKLSHSSSQSPSPSSRRLLMLSIRRQIETFVFNSLEISVSFSSFDLTSNSSDSASSLLFFSASILTFKRLVCSCCVDFKLSTWDLNCVRLSAFGLLRLLLLQHALQLRNLSSFSLTFFNNLARSR